MTLPALQPALLPSPVVWTAGERQAFRRRERLTPSQWAARHRVVTDGPWEGPWSNEHTPYLVEPMDTADLPQVRRVTVVGTPQSGKTQVAYNVWAHRVENRRISSSLITMADEDTAKTISDKRLQPMLQKSAVLAGMITGRARDLSANQLQLTGHLCRLAWATSVARLATLPAELVIGDETDKYPPYKVTQEEADPISLMEARSTAFRHTGLMLLVSTPSVDAGYIWQSALSADEFRVYMARCPDCGGLQIMRLEQLKWADDQPRGVVLAKGLAWYECEHCGSAWDEPQRKAAARAGRYLPHRWNPETRQFDPVEPMESPPHVAFHFSAFYSPFVSLAQIAHAAMLAEEKPSARHDLFNKFLALPHIPERAAPAEEVILRLCDNREPGRPGIVPLAAHSLTAGVDVHTSHPLYFTIRAWGLGPKLESWLVRKGLADSWAGLEEALFSAYLDAEGTEHRIRLGLIDSGYLPEQVYDWARAHRPMLPSKGQEKMSSLWKLGKIDSHPGLQLVNVNTTAIKNSLDNKLALGPVDPGAFHLHKNIDGDLNEYAKQLLGEYMDETGHWLPMPGRKNHWWDSEVLALSAARLLGLDQMTPPQEQQEQLSNDRPKPTKGRKRW